MRSSGEQAKFRRDVFTANKQHDVTGRIFLICYVCNCRIDPASEFWDADHVIARHFGGTEGKPICKACHKHKTATQDVPAIAKSKRTSDKHFGIRRKKPWPKRKFAKPEPVE
jgi:hypothetical protein